LRERDTFAVLNLRIALLLSSASEWFPSRL
jgi:hypothetical protein